MAKGMVPLPGLSARFDEVDEVEPEHIIYEEKWAVPSDSKPPEHWRTATVFVEHHGEMVPAQAGFQKVKIPRHVEAHVIRSGRKWISPVADIPTNWGRKP